MGSPLAGELCPLEDCVHNMLCSLSLALHVPHHVPLSWVRSSFSLSGQVEPSHPYLF